MLSYIFTFLYYWIVIAVTLLYMYHCNAVAGLGGVSFDFFTCCYLNLLQYIIFYKMVRCFVHNKRSINAKFPLEKIMGWKYLVAQYSSKLYSGFRPFRDFETNGRPRKRVNPPYSP